VEVRRAHRSTPVEQQLVLSLAHMQTSRSLLALPPERSVVRFASLTVVILIVVLLRIGQAVILHMIQETTTAGRAQQPRLPLTGDELCTAFTLGAHGRLSGWEWSFCIRVMLFGWGGGCRWCRTGKAQASPHLLLQALQGGHQDCSGRSTDGECAACVLDVVGVGVDVDVWAREPNLHQF
jgi:hypothetical protein